MKHETNPITAKALALATLLQKEIERHVTDASLPEINDACRTIMGLLDTAHTAESHNPAEQFELVAGLMERAEKLRKDGMRKPWEPEED